jgi:hypothetical protein
MIYKILHRKLKIEQREHNYAQIMSISGHVRCHSSIDQSTINIINVERLYDIVNRSFLTRLRTDCRLSLDGI